MHGKANSTKVRFMYCKIGCSDSALARSYRSLSTLLFFPGPLILTYSRGVCLPVWFGVERGGASLFIVDALLAFSFGICTLLVLGFAR